MKNSSIKLLPPNVISASLLPWYDQNKRILPWRALSGTTPNLYHVWLSEIMLQQTTVPTVIPYFLAFIKRWPSIQDLSLASLDDVLHAWQGLGYYARARNLYKCAREITTQHKGSFPNSEQELLKLPGIGPYTAAAISAIAFGQKSSPVDGNIERILSRIYTLNTPLPAAKSILQHLAERHTPENFSGDYAQGLMDLGSMVCTPKRPLCPSCPLQKVCLAFKSQVQENYPLKTLPALKPTRLADTFWIEDKNGFILLEKRPPHGLLGGLIMTPITALNNEVLLPNGLSVQKFRPMNEIVTHTFTHFHLKVRILKASVDAREITLSPQQFWCSPKDLSLQALPSLMKKIIKQIL